jgi:hypothetical protein
MVTVELSANLTMKLAGAHFSDKGSDANEHEKSIGGLLAVYSQSANCTTKSDLAPVPWTYLRRFGLGSAVMVLELRFKLVQFR